MKKIKMLFILLIILFVFEISLSCKENKNELIIFHAGSLSIPFKDMKTAFNKKYPELKILLEAGGSRSCARKISDLKRECDVMASADYMVINNLLIPDFADWNICFATNEMAIMYTKHSKYSKKINSKNWYKILLKDDVEYGHSDPNADPCGYRTLFTWQLAEKYYNIPNLYNNLVDGCPKKNIRSKETDLIALLETGELDYIFIYRSVCTQHNLPFVELQDEINMKNIKHSEFYKNAEVYVTGKNPGEKLKLIGAPMVYGITIPKNAPNEKMAIEFVKFVIGKEGQSIMKKNGQPPIVPVDVVKGKDKIHQDIKKIIK